jgi:hypothetical protein
MKLLPYIALKATGLLALPRDKNDEKCKVFAKDLMWTTSKNGHRIPMKFIDRLD